MTASKWRKKKCGRILKDRHVCNSIFFVDDIFFCNSQSDSDVIIALKK